ncbi:MAG: hypothetical protein JWQ89_424 [Devosia sp.]|nr:hypothetical protein [Devosia sp.]
MLAALIEPVPYRHLLQRGEYLHRVPEPRRILFRPKGMGRREEREAIKQLSMSGYPEKIEAERMIHRGALQVAASISRAILKALFS